MQIMDAVSPEKTADDGLDAAQSVEMADNIVEEADEGGDLSPEYRFAAEEAADGDNDAAESS